jgi:predicted RNA-binding Zn-ribbon protein involved in translation (DUF1610 family)
MKVDKTSLATVEHAGTRHECMACGRSMTVVGQPGRLCAIRYFCGMCGSRLLKRYWIEVRTGAG